MILKMIDSIKELNNRSGIIVTWFMLKFYLETFWSYLSFE